MRSTRIGVGAKEMNHPGWFKYRWYMCWSGEEEEFTCEIARSCRWVEGEWKQ
jgi:hypothetical protein